MPFAIGLILAAWLAPSTSRCSGSISAIPALHGAAALGSSAANISGSDLLPLVDSPLDDLFNEYAPQTFNEYTRTEPIDIQVISVSEYIRCSTLHSEPP